MQTALLLFNPKGVKNTTPNMKRNLLLAQSNVLNLFQLKSLQLLLVVFFVIGSSTKVQGQCIGPYQYFDSFRPASGRPTMILATGSGGDGWILSAASVTPANAAANARTGINYFLPQLQTVNNLYLFLH